VQATLEDFFKALRGSDLEIHLNAQVDAARAVELVGWSDRALLKSALGTTLEGSPDDVWAVLRAAHEATLAVGATVTITFIKLAEGVDDGGPTMDRLTRKFRD